MLAKLLSWKIGGLAVLAATAVWASVGPDSIIQNNVVDKVRATQALGRLMEVSDSDPLGIRYPIVIIPGKNSSKDPNGPSESEILEMVRAVLGGDWQSSYQNWTGYIFAEDVKVYVFWYNSDSADPDIAQSMNALVEGSPDLTKAGIRFSSVTHSKGGNILFCYSVQTDNRKLDAKVSSAAPTIGTGMADRNKVAQGIRRAFPLLGKLLNKLLGNRGMDLDSPGVQWLLPNYPPMIELRKKHPLDSSWTLIGGKVKPTGKSVIARNLDLGFLLDRTLLEGGNDQDTKAYQVGALIMKEMGVTCGSDGVVPLDSALCRGYAGGANTIVLPSDHNHSQMWWGNSSMEAHDAMLKPIIPYILANKEANKKLHLTMWLPEMPVIKIPETQTDGLEQARLVWGNEEGGISVADSQFANPRKLYLPEGRYFWPQWFGDGFVATWSHQGGNDIVSVFDGQVVQLTTDGQSSLATAGDGKIVFLGNGNLVLRTAGGLAKVLVRGPLLMEYPPVIMGDKVYFTVSNSLGGADLRWVSTEVSDYPLAKTRLVESQVTHPMKIGDVLLAVKVGADSSSLTVVTGKWGTLRATLATGMKTLNESFAGGSVPLPTLLDMDSQENWLYLVIGNDIRQLDVGAIAQTIASGGGSITLDQAAIRRVTGTQFDAK